MEVSCIFHIDNPLLTPVYLNIWIRSMNMLKDIGHMPPYFRLMYKYCTSTAIRIFMLRYYMNFSVSWCYFKLILFLFQGFEKQLERIFVQAGFYLSPDIKKSLLYNVSLFIPFLIFTSVNFIQIVMECLKLYTFLKMIVFWIWVWCLWCSYCIVWTMYV